jgi:hypothetical protein
MTAFSSHWRVSLMISASVFMAVIVDPGLNAAAKVIANQEIDR